MGGHLVNIFTRSNYTAGGLASLDEVTKMRGAEDAVFSATCSLHGHDLGLSDAPVLGLTPFDLKDIDREVDEVDRSLMPLLLSLLDGGGADNAEVYCPLAVGRHRNHLSVFLSVVRAWAALQEKARIFFYEDLPYASNIESRKEAVQRLLHHFPQKKFLRHANQMTEDEMNRKLELASIYKSQHAGPVVKGNFIPAEPLTPFPHEAFWEMA